MAAKKVPHKSNAIQLTAFDVDSTKQVYQESNSVKKKDAISSATIDVNNLGLNSVYEGRSAVYSSFSDYIKRSNLIK